MEKNENEVEKRIDSDESGEKGHHQERKARKKRSSGQHSSSDEEDGSYERRRRKKKKRRRRREEERSDEKDNNESEEDGSRRRKKKRSKSRKRSKRDYSSSSASSSDDSSESEESRRRRKKKKDKKRKKHKKSKKKKRSRRDSSDEDDAPADGGAPTFGKYGIIKAGDFTRMQRSFEVWLAEVKGIPSITGSRHEQQKYFADFCEDFNTATMPHEKYYDYEKWEMQEYQKQKAKEDKLSIKGNTVLADEARHKREQQERAKAQQESERRALYGSMSQEKVEEMKHQARLRSQMQIAYRTGDKKTYQRLKDRLESDV